jgi:hypothetical protein
MKMREKIILLLILVFISGNSYALDSLRGVFTELFTDKEKLFTPLLDKNFIIDKAGEELVLEGDFSVSYSGQYSIYMWFDFIDGYEERVIEGLIWPAQREEKKQLIESMSFDLRGVFTLSSVADPTFVYKNINMNHIVGPTYQGLGLIIFSSPVDIPKGKKIQMRIKIPRYPTNNLFYERYKSVTIVIKRLSSLSH